MASSRNQREKELEREAQARRAAEERREEQARIRSEKLAIIKAERARMDELRQQTKDWCTSEKIRAYIDFVKQKVIAESGEIDPGSPFAQWAEWATLQADRLDPTVENSPSILDEEAALLEDEQRHRRGW